MNEESIRSEVWQAVLPLSRPIGTAIGEFREVNAVVVRLRDASGLEGCGYALAFDPPSFDHLANAAARLLAGQGGRLARLIRIERLADDGGDQIVRKAVAAISLASWDLLGRQRGKACAELWGGPHRAALPVYASALFADRSAQELIAEARELRNAGFRFVKMRGGKSPAEDAACFDAVRTVYPEKHCVAIDFFFHSDLARVKEFLGKVSAEPMWVEDPTNYDVIHQFSAAERIAAGEKCASAEELLALRAGGVRRLILDVEYLGGPLRFLETARTLQALGCEIGSHMFAHDSAHLLAALPESMPVEVLDWWNLLFSEAPLPDASGRLAVRGPGLGRTLRQEILERHGKKIA